MPHMMPMLWMLIFIMTFIALFFLSTLVYFFYIPMPIVKPSTFKYHKWNWMW